MMSYNVKDYLKIYDNCVDNELRDKLFAELQNPNIWEKHTYYDYKNNKNKSYNDDLYVCESPLKESQKITEIVWNTILQYMNDLDFSWYRSWAGFTPIRFNKYTIGTLMRQHCDHINSMFDGEIKGIPTLSVLGALNDDYDGGDLIFWDSEKIELKAGQIMIFPSNFLYPHEVLPVTRGERHSFVSWVW